MARAAIHFPDGGTNDVVGGLALITNTIPADEKVNMVMMGSKNVTAYLPKPYTNVQAAGQVIRLGRRGCV